MAYTDLGALAPSETQQGASHLAAARAEGTRQASYLASMDQFYAGLEASVTAQDKDIAANKEQWTSYLGHETAKLAKQDEWEGAMQSYRTRSLDIQEKNAAAQLTFNYAEAARQEEHDDAMDAYRIRSLDIQEKSVAASSAYGTRQLDLQDKWNTAEGERETRRIDIGESQYATSLDWEERKTAILDETEDERIAAGERIASADRSSRESLSNAQLASNERIAEWQIDLARDEFNWEKIESQWMMDQYEAESGTSEFTTWEGADPRLGPGAFFLDPRTGELRQTPRGY